MEDQTKNPTTTLSKERMGEMALALLTYRLYEKGEITLGPGLKREVGEIIKYLDFDPSEAHEFVRFIITDAMNKTLKSLEKSRKG